MCSSDNATRAFNLITYSLLLMVTIISDDVRVQFSLNGNYYYRYFMMINNNYISHKYCFFLIL